MKLGAGFGVWLLGLGLGLVWGFEFRVLGLASGFNFWGGGAAPSADIVVGDADGVAEAHKLDRL